MELRLFQVGVWLTDPPVWVWAVVVLGVDDLHPPVFGGSKPRENPSQAVATSQAYAESLARRRYGKTVPISWVKEHAVPVRAHELVNQHLQRMVQNAKRGPRTRKVRGRTIQIAPSPLPAATLLRVPKTDRRRYKAGRSRLLALIARDGMSCFWCGKQTRLDVVPDHPDRCTRDHIVPRVFGGKDALENLKVACRECNERRGDSIGPPPPRKISSSESDPDTY